MDWLQLNGRCSSRLGTSAGLRSQSMTRLAGFKLWRSIAS
jgi:hypothetical protein